MSLPVDIVCVHVRAYLACRIAGRGDERFVAMSFNQVQVVPVRPYSVWYVRFCCFIQFDFHGVFLLSVFQVCTWQYYCQCVTCVIK